MQPTATNILRHGSCALELMIKLAPKLEAIAFDASAHGLAPLLDGLVQPADKEGIQCSRQVPGTDSLNGCPKKGFVRHF